MGDRDLLIRDRKIVVRHFTRPDGRAMRALVLDTEDCRSVCCGGVGCACCDVHTPLCFATGDPTGCTPQRLSDCAFRFSIAYSITGTELMTRTGSGSSCLMPTFSRDYQSPEVVVDRVAGSNIRCELQDLVGRQVHPLIDIQDEFWETRYRIDTGGPGYFTEAFHPVGECPASLDFDRVASDGPLLIPCPYLSFGIKHGYGPIGGASCTDRRVRFYYSYETEQLTVVMTAGTWTSISSGTITITSFVADQCVNGQPTRFSIGIRYTLHRPNGTSGAVWDHEGDFTYNVSFPRGVSGCGPVSGHCANGKPPPIIGDPIQLQGPPPPGTPAVGSVGLL